MIIRQTRSTQRKGRSCCVDRDAWARCGSADICTEKQANHVTGEQTYAAQIRGALQKRGCTTEISRLTCHFVWSVFFFGANSVEPGRQPTAAKCRGMGTSDRRPKHRTRSSARCALKQPQGQVRRAPLQKLCWLAPCTPPLRRAEASRESPPLLAHTVTQCANGHPFCGACVQVQTRCPKCRHPMDPANPIRCLVAEQVPARCCSFLRAGGPRTRAPQPARPLLVPVVANDWALCRAGASASAC